MAEKKYYWLKLKEDFFLQPKIKKLRRIAGGDTYTVIYLKMQLLSIRNGGVLVYEGIENDFASELALTLDEDEENIRFTLMYLQSQGLIEESSDGKKFAIPSAMESIGKETSAAERMRKFRKQEQALQCNTNVTEERNNVTDERNNVQTCYTDIDIDIDKDKDKEKEKKKDNNIAPSDKPPFITLALNSGEYHVSIDEVEQYKKLYPAVDVEQEFRNMCGWLLSNPTQRKTKSGIKRFINGWLAREQNAPKNSMQKPKKQNGFEHNGRDLSYLVE